MVSRLARLYGGHRRLYTRLGQRGVECRPSWNWRWTRPARLKAWGEVPVGCVIVRDGAVIAAAGNRTLADRDPTAHAEMIAIRARRAKARLRAAHRMRPFTSRSSPAPCAQRRFRSPASAGSVTARPIPRAVLVDSGVRFFRVADLPSPARSLWRHQRSRIRDIAAGDFCNAALGRLGRQPAVLVGAIAQPELREAQVDVAGSFAGHLQPLTELEEMRLGAFEPVVRRSRVPDVEMRRSSIAA